MAERGELLPGRAGSVTKRGRPIGKRGQSKSSSHMHNSDRRSYERGKKRKWTFKSRGDCYI